MYKRIMGIPFLFAAGVIANAPVHNDVWVFERFIDWVALLVIFLAVGVWLIISGDDHPWRYDAQGSSRICGLCGQQQDVFQTYIGGKPANYATWREAIGEIIDPKCKCHKYCRAKRGD